MLQQGRRRNLVTWWSESFHEVHRRPIPTRGKPQNAAPAAMIINLAKLGDAELHALAVIHVADVTPGCFAHLLTLFHWDTQLRGTLLKLDRVTASYGRSIN